MAYLALQEAYMQDPLITIRVVIFASWRKERTSLESTASVSHPRTRSSCGLWLPFPPSSKVWTIDSSWSLQNSSLVYLDGDFGLCLFGSTSPRRFKNLLRLLEDFLSTKSPPASLWHRILGHVSLLSFSSLTGCSDGGCFGLASRINGISWTTSFRSPGSLSVESLLPWWTRVAQLLEGVSFSSLVWEVSFLSDASDVDCRPS